MQSHSRYDARLVLWHGKARGKRSRKAEQVRKRHESMENTLGPTLKETKIMLFNTIPWASISYR